MSPLPSCPVCQAPCLHLDHVDFNKACLDGNGKVFPDAGGPVAYSICASCGFCFSPELCAWSPQEFSEKIYNDQYVLVDPDYIDVRPRSNAGVLIDTFGDSLHGIRHLDYGGGSGALAGLLAQAGWQSTTYDPFVHPDTAIASLGQFDLITAFEVFEHVPDVHQLVANLRSLLAPGGAVMFTTLLTDGNVRLGQKLSWWYASPRNGHISLFSRNSLQKLAEAHGLKFGSFSPNFHTLFTTPPAWLPSRMN